MYLWSDDDVGLKEMGARLCGDYVVGDYRFELLSGSYWIVEAQPEKVADLLLDWFGHSGA